METLLQKTGLQSRRFRTRFAGGNENSNSQLVFGRSNVSINGNELMLINSQDNYGKLSLHLETKDHLQKYMITFAENRLFFGE